MLFFGTVTRNNLKKQAVTETAIFKSVESLIHKLRFRQGLKSDFFRNKRYLVHQLLNGLQDIKFPVMNSKIFNIKNIINTRWEFFICLFLVVATFTLYYQVRHFEFVNFDDFIYVKNPYVQTGFTIEGISWFFNISRNWHPLTWLSHTLDYQLYGFNSGMHHLTNLIIHIINSILLFIVFRRMTGFLWRSAFIAALFALHPINVESVAWVAERKNVLSTLFWMLTMLAYTLYAEKQRFYRYLFVLLIFALGLMAKPMLVTLPFVLLLIDYWPLRRFKIEQWGAISNDKISKSPRSKMYGCNIKGSVVLHLVLEKIPLLALSIISIYYSLLRVGPVVPIEVVSVKLRIANALICYLQYIVKLFWPHNLAYFYPYPDKVPLWQTTGALLFIICISVIVVKLIKKMPYLIVGWLWFLGALVPVSGIVQKGIQPAMADRYAYVTLIGLFIIISWGVPDLLKKYPNSKIGLAILSASIISVLSITTWFQAKYWTNSKILNEHALGVTSNNYIAHNGMGTALFFQGKLSGALDQYSEALRINPDFTRAQNNMGLVLIRLGRIKEAIINFRMASLAGYVDAHYNLKRALKDKFNIDKAVKKMKEALDINPEDPELYKKLEILHQRKIELNRVIGEYIKALSVQSGFKKVILKNIEKFYAIKNEYDKILSLYIKMAECKPDNLVALYNIACILAMQNRKEESIEWLDKAIRQGFNNWSLLNTDEDLENIRRSSYFIKLIRDNRIDNNSKNFETIAY